MKLNTMIFGSLWLGFTGYAFFLAPPDRSDTLQLIINLSTGNWTGINPLIIALFNLMGILPMVYACLLLIDGKTQKLSAGLFSAASFVVGAFAILPYLALREPNSASSANSRSDNNIERRGIIKLVDSRWLGVVLILGTIVLITYGITKGNWSDFSHQWQTNRFIHVMSLDFCLLSLLLPVLIADDIERRNFISPQFIKQLSLIPLFGGLIYLCIRPNLPDANKKSQPKVSTIAN
jgi:hypothetical protein